MNKKILITGLFFVFVIFVGVMFKKDIVDTVKYIRQATKMTMFFAGIPTAEDRVEMAKEAKRLDPTTYFSDQKVIDFCLAMALLHNYQKSHNPPCTFKIYSIT